MGMVVNVEANIGHSSGSGSQRKRVAREEVVRGENWGETGDVRERVG